MKITFKKFNETIELLKRRDKQYKELNKVFREIHTDSYIMPDLQLETTVVRLLELLTNDKNEFISYFIYDLDFGKEYTENCYTINNKEVKLKTTKDLYKELEYYYDKD